MAASIFESTPSCAKITVPEGQQSNDWILPFTRRKTSQHGASIRLPVGGRTPIGVGRGPLCVPWRASSTTTASPTLKNRYNSRCMSGNAFAYTSTVLPRPVGPSGPLYVTPIDVSVNVPSEVKHSTQPLTSTFSASSYALRMICSLFIGKSFLFDLKKLRAQGSLSK